MLLTDEIRLLKSLTKRLQSQIIGQWTEEVQYSSLNERLGFNPRFAQIDEHNINFNVMEMEAAHPLHTWTQVGSI